MAEQKERLPQLDLFRAFAILGVLHVHSSSYAAGIQALNSPYYYVYSFMNIFFKFGTPCFIFLSSFVLFYNYYERPFTSRLITMFYHKRWLYILLPYALASLIYFLLATYVNGLTHSSLAEHLTRFLFALGTGTAYTHLYFVFISAQFYILFPILLALLKSQRWLVRWSIPVGLLLQWAFVFWNKYDLKMMDKGNYALSYLAYYMMGAFIAVYFQQWKVWLTGKWSDMSTKLKLWTVTLWTSWLVAALVHVEVWHVSRLTNKWLDSLWYELLWNVHTMLSALVLLHAAFHIYKLGSSKGQGVIGSTVILLLRRLGELSFAIYLVHPLVLAVYRKFRYTISPESMTYMFWIFGGLLSALLLSWAVVQFAFRRIPFAWMFLGNVPVFLREKSKAVQQPLHKKNESEQADMKLS
ncbi:acyltransferase [Paenibacillus sediminis]|uniref:Peptidoglycan/LPS O-acetylase OafA/YrhL n=1 Tax=Paenibacillus sediminis TaxID=664909 RepID=A0ABS4H3I5_9BACL|nr:acyltransferase [Paenibacillus sediminis]MBP1937093.1 peptidoglycan/LPS O-acetylase OafA/YrhL [Paenibacillus sediminis]